MLFLFAPRHHRAVPSAQTRTAPHRTAAVFACLDFPSWRWVSAPLPKSADAHSRGGPWVIQAMASWVVFGAPVRWVRCGWAVIVSACLAAFLARCVFEMATPQDHLHPRRWRPVGQFSANNRHAVPLLHMLGELGTVGAQVNRFATAGAKTLAPIGRLRQVMPVFGARLRNGNLPAIDAGFDGFHEQRTKLARPWQSAFRHKRHLATANLHQAWRNARVPCPKPASGTGHVARATLALSAAIQASMPAATLHLLTHWC